MTRSEAVTTFLTQGYNCARAIVATFAEDHGMTRETALTLSQNPGSGGAFQRGQCSQ